MIALNWVVKVEGRIVEDTTEHSPHEVESFAEVGKVLEEIRRNWGVNCDIDLHVWRDNWMR
jgi:hypothetical protein